MVDYEKVIQRVENMLYSISGCNPKEAKIVLEKCLKRNKLRVGKI
jgi:N-acetylmuramic acid 6-phosphate (MurNAc-6-P) etherase